MTLSLADTNRLLDHQRVSIALRLEEIDKDFPDGSNETSGFVSNWEAKLLICMKHAGDNIDGFRDSLAYIEGTMYEQLAQAIGKELTPRYFDQFMRLHDKRLFS